MENSEGFPSCSVHSPISTLHQTWRENPSIQTDSSFPRVPPEMLLGVGLSGCLEIFEYKRKIAEMTSTKQLCFPKKGTP